MSLLRPISSCNPWQKIKMLDKLTRSYVGGYVVVGHDIAIEQGASAGLSTLDIDPTKYRFTKAPGATVVANQGQHQGATGWRFYTVKSTAMVQLDE